MVALKTKSRGQYEASVAAGRTERRARTFIFWLESFESVEAEKCGEVG